MRLWIALGLSVAVNVLLCYVIQVTLIDPHPRFRKEKDAIYFWVRNNKDRIKREFGFDLDGKYVDRKPVLVVTKVEKGGLFDRAGIVKGSALIDGTDIWVYFALDAARLKPVELELRMPDGNMQTFVFGGDPVEGKHLIDEK